MHGLSAIRAMNHPDFDRARSSTTTTHRVNLGGWSYDPTGIPALLAALTADLASYPELDAALQAVNPQREGSRR